MTPNREDYLKIILELGGDTTKVNNKQIVSTWMSRLHLSVK